MQPGAEVVSADRIPNWSAAFGPLSHRADAPNWTTISSQIYGYDGFRAAIHFCDERLELVLSYSTSARTDYTLTGASTTVSLYACQEPNGETGLDYFGARYFSAAQGRFTSPDPIVHPSESKAGFETFISEPQRWNKYAYVSNNPLKYVDPNGAEQVVGCLGGQCYSNVTGQPVARSTNRDLMVTAAVAAAGTVGFFAPEIVAAISGLFPALVPGVNGLLQDEPGVSSRLASALNSADPAIQAEGQVGSFLSRNGLLQNFNTTVKDAATGLPRQIDIVAGKAGEFVVEVTTGTGKGKLGQVAAQAATTGKQGIVYGTNLSRGFVQEAQRQGVKVAQSLDELKRIVGGGSQ